MKLEFSVCRYSSDVGDASRMQDYTLEVEEGRDMTLLGTLMQLREKDPSLPFRRSCREGVCGSDGLSINDENGLACITPTSTLDQPDKKIITRPLPGLPVVHDLVIDMGQSYAQCEEVRLYLLDNGKNPPAREYLQMPEQREKLDGLYKCILCACCSTFCPSSWWSPDKFIGPTGLLAACRSLIDSRDTEVGSRLGDLSDTFSIFHCHSIMNYVSVCPKGLNPTRAINHIKSMLLRRSAQVVAVVTGWRRNVLSGLRVTHLISPIGEAPSDSLSVGSL